MRKSFFAMSFALMAMILIANLSLRLYTQPASSISTPGVGYTVGNTSNTVHPAISTASSTDTNNAQTEARTAATVSEVTRNWAGYLASGNAYTGVSGTWTVPNVSAGTEDLSADAAWIGIGGSSSDDLIQVGTENMVENGQIITSAFYEGLPADSQDIPTLSVNPGDTVSASITETSAGVWNIAIKDLTNGGSFTQPVYYNSSKSSAEWIEEAPSDQTGIMALDNFDTVDFNNAAAITNGHSTSLAASGAEAVGMDNQAGEPLATVSNLNGSSFDVSRTDAGNDNSSANYNSGGFPTDGWRGYQTRPDNNSYPGYSHFRYF